MAAFGLDAKTESPVTVRDMLAGGVSDPNSPANQLTDKRYAAFVRAFDFSQYGTATTARAEVTQATPALYLQSDNPDNAYFRANIGSVKSVKVYAPDGSMSSFNGSMPLKMSISRSVSGNTSTYTYNVENTFTKTQNVSYTDTAGKSHTFSQTLQRNDMGVASLSSSRSVDR